MNSAPRTLHIVLNGVTEDSRVLKCAWSLGNAGWDVIVVGATATAHSDSLNIGYARILRLPLKFVIVKGRKTSIFHYLIRGEKTEWLVLGILRRLRRYRRRLFERFKVKSEIVVPNLHRSVKAITPIAMDFNPHIVHAHDYTALPIAGAIVDALRAKGKSVHLVYDAHEYVPGVAHLTTPMATLYTTHERRYSALAAAVLSVSEPMNDLLLEQLQIERRPTVVANDPLVEGQQISKRNLRNDIGISDETPLLVYAGAVAPQRGIQTAVAALSELVGVHLVLIADPKSKSVLDLVESAKSVHNRFHVVPYVPNSELVSYLSTADIGLIPILHRLNHEISLITKFGEYMQAHLPILVSDVKTMAAEVRKLGNGEVFVAGDVADFVRATKLMLANPAHYRAAYTPEVLAMRSWEGQAELLVNTYNQIAGVTTTARTHLPFVISDPVPLAKLN